MTAERPRILYLIGQLSIGGAELQLIQLAKHLNRTRFEPIVCVLSECVPLAEGLRDAGIEVFVLPRKMDPDLTRLWRLPCVVRRYRPALIHSYVQVANAWARLVGRLMGIPTVISERSAATRKEASWIVIDRLLASWTSLMIANSRAGAQLAIARREISPNRVVVVRNGVALPRTGSAADTRQVRSGLGLGQADQVVGVVGRLSVEKDHRTFLQAMTIVAAQIPSLRLLCVGDGPLRAELETLASELGLGDHIVFAGSRSDIPEIMKALDLVVLSSKWEGLPNALMEAMAASRPVVATRVGGIPELVSDGETGLLVPPGDAPALAEAVLQLLKHPAQAAEMGRRGRTRVEQHFSIERMVANTEAIYDQLLR